MQRNKQEKGGKGSEKTPSFSSPTIPTNLFKILELKNPSMEVPEQQKIRQYSDRWAIKL